MEGEGVLHHSLRNNLSAVGRQAARATVQRISQVLPNRWMFHHLVKWCGAQATTLETLGNGMKVEVFFGDIIGCHIHYSGWYERTVVQALVPLLHPNTVFVDVGANIGQYTLLASQYVRQVFALEPNPRTFAVLQRNVQRNGLANVKLFQAAAFSRDGEAMIFDADPTNHGGASLAGKVGGQKVPTCTIDSILSAAPVAGNPLFLKIDVEGAELDALLGAMQTIADHMPTILIEILEANQRRFGRTAAYLRGLLRKCGYSLWSVAPAGLIPYDAEHPNVLATASPNP